jgi:hypothetical protein
MDKLTIPEPEPRPRPGGIRRCADLSPGGKVFGAWRALQYFLGALTLHFRRGSFLAA